LSVHKEIGELVFVMPSAAYSGDMRNIGVVSAMDELMTDERGVGPGYFVYFGAEGEGHWIMNSRIVSVVPERGALALYEKGTN
jgi:hypothetical protein|tara:strand:+ start:321 stop:569 length:249 start_codon:yes stop_codon:yes gene_type:complete